MRIFELWKLNIIVGANGAGKSDFLSFFHLLRNFIQGRLPQYIEEHGWADKFLFNGPKETKKIYFEVHFGCRGYRFSLHPSIDGRYFSTRNEARYYKHSINSWQELGCNSAAESTMAQEARRNMPDARYSRPVYDAIMSWQWHHFHDTSHTAGIRRYSSIEHWEKLEPDASNLPSFLRNLREKHPDSYQQIVDTVRTVMPFFDDFSLTPQGPEENQKINLSWKQKGSDYPMQPYHLSDGSIRFICLASALLQTELPSTVIIDEPELGLHPEAIAVLAELAEAASRRTQIILATQSPLFLNHFGIDDIIVAKRRNGASIFERLKEEDYAHWLEDFNVGELWSKNVIEGGASYE